MALDERKLAVLRAIVEDFVLTHEPVASRALAESSGLKVSPATIRNDMAVLEEDGYITQPHTSAGRIPTDKGYRLFVDRLSTVKPLSAAERRAISRFLEGAVDLDDVVHRTVRLLAQLTGAAAMVQYPTLNRSSVRHVELVPLLDRRALLVLITDTGRVEQRVVDLAQQSSAEQLDELRRQVNTRVGGREVTEAASELTSLAESVAPDLRPTAESVARVLSETLAAEASTGRFATGGAANLARTRDFAGQVRPVLEALEEEVVLLRLFDELDKPAQVHVRIGEENEVDRLRSASVISIGYGPGAHVLGGIGVVGPTAMDYPSTIAAVRAVARYVGTIVAGG
jgi:heat-inducible transcriptional repressor